MGQDLARHLIKEGIQMENRHTKRNSASNAVWNYRLTEKQSARPQL